MIDLPAFGEDGARYKELVTALSTNDLSRIKEWNEVFDSVHARVIEKVGSSKVLLPSALIVILQKNVENVLSDVNSRMHLCQLIQILAPCAKFTAHQFICDYVLSLILEVLRLVSATMRENMTKCVLWNKEIELDVEDMESIHYVAGATVRSFHKKARQFPKNPGWSLIGRVIHERLLESDTVPGVPPIVKGWTKNKDKGKLFLVSDVLYNFFCGVTELLEKDTSTHGVNHDFMLEQVSNSASILLWDEAVSDSLPQQLSYNFMKGMVRSFSQTFGVGKAKKVMNAARKKAEASVPLRHKVAPR